ncbi:hypothetical protein SESBI_16328 [Sesbania bispinosa]|nr:hypothetical protein SESBI_16328 [Sesbania bispinosa]
MAATVFSFISEEESKAESNGFSFRRSGVRVSRRDAAAEEDVAVGDVAIECGEEGVEVALGLEFAAGEWRRSRREGWMRKDLGYAAEKSARWVWRWVSLTRARRPLALRWWTWGFPDRGGEHREVEQRGMGPIPFDSSCCCCSSSDLNVSEKRERERKVEYRNKQGRVASSRGEESETRKERVSNDLTVRGKTRGFGA